MVKKKKSIKTHRRTWKAVAIALYITFLLLSTIPFMADNLIEPEMKDSYTYHLTYPVDGRQTHYYVERVDTREIGKIDLVYTTDTNSLQVKTENIEVLHIYCRSMYEEECRKVYGIDPSDNLNYFKWYFIEKNHFSVNIESDHVIKELSFIDTPIPYAVYVNGLHWVEGRQYNYTDSYSTAISNVPKGNTHVDIYFKADDKNRPYAHISADKTLVNINSPVYFDANKSYDLDGEIIAYIWDFSDGNNSGGVVNAHSFSRIGEYGVILTVRDNDFLIDHAFLNITVVKGDNQPVINGIIPDQIKEEDSPSWELNLSSYGIDLDSAPSELRWYITGEDTSLYQVIGENSTEQKLIFQPMSNAYGNNQVKLWLTDKDGYNTSQSLWVNITPVNDRPVIEKLPDLMVHYDVEYVFTLTNYISDIETPTEDLIISAYDKYGKEYIAVTGYDIIFKYPEELNNEIILVMVVVSDGEDSSNGIITVTVSDNWPPILIKELPDVELDEKTTSANVFDLDDYFVDPDGDELYYTYGQSNVEIYIHSDNSVDISSRTEWTGEEFMVFRARDSKGAIIEDRIKITVKPINDPPIIGNVPHLLVHFDMDYYFDVSFYISDPDNDLSELTLTVSDPDHIKISKPANHLGIILNYPKSMLGITSEVVLTVDDGKLKTSKNVSVLVIAEYPPELVIKLPDVVFFEDESLEDFIDLDDYFIDLDNDTLYYTIGQEQIDITINSKHEVSFHAPQNWFGVEEVTVRATDPIGALVEDSITITVLPVNDPPVLSQLPSVVINETETIEIDLIQYISDVDTNISHIIILVEDENVFLTGTSLVIFGSRELPNELKIIISDGELTDSGILTIEVPIEESPKDDTVSLVILFFVILIIIIILTIFLIVRHIYKKLQKFDVREIFLIHNSGKLITHASIEAHTKFDNDIFSGMFTAIQAFIEDSFSEEGPNQSTSPAASPGLETKDDTQSDGSDKSMKLNEFKVGDNQVLIEHGNFIFMAVVYTGPGAQALHKVIKQNIQNIEMRYRTALEFWVGDMKQIKGIKKLVEPLLSKDKVAEKVAMKDAVKDAEKVAVKVAEIEEAKTAAIIPIIVPKENRPFNRDGVQKQPSHLRPMQSHTGQDDRPNQPRLQEQFAQSIQPTPKVRTSQVSQPLHLGSTSGAINKRQLK